MKKINPIDEYEEIARFKNNVEDMTNSSDIKKLREENRRMKIELTAIKNVIKRYMVTAPPPKLSRKGVTFMGRKKRSRIHHKLFWLWACIPLSCSFVILRYQFGVHYGI